MHFWGTDVPIQSDLTDSLVTRDLSAASCNLIEAKEKKWLTHIFSSSEKVNPITTITMSGLHSPHECQNHFLKMFWEWDMLLLRLFFSARGAWMKLHLQMVKNLKSWILDRKFNSSLWSKHSLSAAGQLSAEPRNDKCYYYYCYFYHYNYWFLCS